MPDEPTAEIDERWLIEYLEYGLKEIRKSLKRHADFEEYLKANRTITEQEDEALD